MTDQDLEGDVIEEGTDSLSAFLAAALAAPAFDPNTAVIIKTAGGGATMVPISEPTSIAEVLRRAELAIGANVEYWEIGRAHV